MASITDNIVIAGDYKNKPVMASPIKGEAYLQIGITKKIPLNKTTVEKYEVQGGKEKANTAGAVGRGIVGGALFGGVGAIIGAATRKKKSLTRVAVDFKDGKHSLIQMNDDVLGKFQQGLF